MSVSFVPRARRRWVLLLPAVALALGLGCGHRRQAMRPVYMTPAPAVSAPCPTATPTPSVGEPVLSAPTTSGVTVPMVDPSTPPAASTAPRSSLPDDEPGLQLSPNDPPTGSSAPPRLQGPADGSTSSSLKSGRRDAPARTRQASLRQRLRPLVNDPDDLFSPPKADRPWKYVVLHHSAKSSGSYDEIDREHRKVLGWDGCGYHFVIGNGTGSADGQIEVARRWSEQKHGVHCRNGKTADINEYGIGICLVGNLDQAPPTPKQVASARALVAYLSSRYQIPVTRVETHAHLAASPTVCPGKLFPSDAILGTSGNVVQR